MAKEKQTIIDEALLDMQKIEEALKANTKEILRSVMKEEIEGYVNESINEDGYEEEDIDVTDELPEPETGEEDAEAEVSDELPVDVDAELGDDAAGEEEVEASDELPVDLDMTNASDDDVIAVYKKLSGDDEIEVVSDNEVKITDPKSGNQYVIKLGGGAGQESELPVEVDTDLDGDDVDDIGYDDIDDIGVDDETDDDLDEAVVYEIELQEDETTNEDIVRGKGHDTEVKNSKAPNTGDIEKQKAPVGKEKNNNWAGDNLDGGFDEDVTDGDGHAEHVMEEENISDEEISEEEVVDGEKVEEKISVGTGMSVGKHRNATGAGSIGAPENPKSNNESIQAKYNALLKENAVFKETLKKFRSMLTETVVFNSNLAHVVKLFSEHTTTKDEKRQIINRFDENVSSLKESKKLYKTIVSELSNKKTVTESVESKINKEAGSSKSQISESTAYVDNSTKRINDLIKRVENR